MEGPHPVLATLIECRLPLIESKVRKSTTLAGGRSRAPAFARFLEEKVLQYPLSSFSALPRDFYEGSSS